MMNYRITIVIHDMGHVLFDSESILVPSVMSGSSHMFK